MQQAITFVVWALDYRISPQRDSYISAMAQRPVLFVLLAGCFIIHYMITLVYCLFKHFHNKAIIQPLYTVMITHVIYKAASLYDDCLLLQGFVYVANTK